MENKASYPRNTNDRGKRIGYVFGRQIGRALLLAACLLLAGPSHLWAAITATATPIVLTFNPAPVGIAAAMAQQLLVSFNVSGYPGTFTPTATLHYGYDYSAGAVGCTGGASPETCTVTITFQPTLPGARKDALLLMNGTTILTTVPLGGIGQAPLALVQPGVVTNPISGASYYVYNSAVDENGTAYILSDITNAVYSVTKAGVVTQLPITGLSSPAGIAVDGAGTLYIAQNTYSHNIVTYTAGGVQGAINVTPPAPYVPCSNGGPLEYLIAVAVDDAGNLFADEVLCQQIFELEASGTYVTTTISPSITQAYEIAVDSTDDVFIGGYTINELTFGGMQTQINAVGAPQGIAVDAAGTVYATRYTGFGGVVELPASSFLPAGSGAPLAALDPTASPLGLSLGSDGTLYVGNYGNLDKVDRSQGVIAFGLQTANVTSAAQNISIYNGGNEALTFSNIALTGAGSGFAMQTPTGGCTDATVLAPGTLCQIAVTLTPPNAGIFSGTLTFTTNSLNTTGTVANVALSGAVYGAYVTPSPTSLPFGSQNTGTTSAAQTVTLTNNGDLYSGSLGTPSTLAGFNVSLGTCTSAIAVGASCQISVTFEPTLAQAYSGTITIPVGSFGAPPPPVSFTVSGTGVTPNPVASVSPPNLPFANQLLGTTSGSQPVTLSNTGTAPLTIASIAITGANATSFAVAAAGTTCSTSSPLAAGGSCTINVTFTPTATGSLSGTLTITDNSNGMTGSTQTVGLTGTGTAPVATVSSPLTFTGQLVGTTSGSQSVTLGNTTGTAPLTIAGIAITGANASSFAVAAAGTTCSTSSPVMAGSSCTINVTFTPTAIGLLTGTLTITDNSNEVPGSTQTVGLTGTGIAPVASVSPPNLPFGNQILGTTSGSQSVTVSNTTGTAPLTIAGIAFTGANASSYAVAAAGTTCSTGSPVTAGASCTINVTFTPTATGPLNGTLTITDNSNEVPGSTQTVGLTGTGTAPVATVSSPLTFSGQLLETTSASQSVTLSNATGTAPLTISSISFTGANASSFAVATAGTTCSTSSPVAAGASCTINVTFTPTATGPLNGTLTITDNSNEVPGSTQTVGLTGTGTAPVATVSSPLTFSGQLLQTTSASQSVTLSNATGTAPLTISGISFTGANASSFAVAAAGTTCSTSSPVAAGGSCTINVTFTPTATGALTGTLTVTDNSNGVTGSMQTVGLTGTGTAPVAGLSPPLTFSGQNVGTTSVAQAVTLSNTTGTAALTIASIAISGPNASSFAVASVGTTCSTSSPVAAGASCTINVTVTPTAVGALTGTLTVTDNSNGVGGSTQTVTLSGTGTGPPLATLSTPSLNFGNQFLNTTSAAQTETVTNTGTISLAISTAAISGTNASDFVKTADTCTGATLTTSGTSSTCTVSVTFTPAAATTAGASLTFTDNNNNVTGSTQVVALTGTGTAPVAGISPPSLTFSSQNVATTSASQAITLNNTTGTAALTITSIAITGANASSFAVASAGTTCLTSSPLASGGACTINVTFTPTATGSLNGTLTVTDNSNAVGGSTQTVTLSGTGTGVAIGTLSAPSLSFANQPISTTSTALTETVTNTGTINLTITTATLGGTNASAFAKATDTCTGATVIPNGTCTVSVTFTPAATGVLSGTLTFTDNNNNVVGSMQAASLSGTGVDFALAVPTGTQSVTQGGNAQYTINVTSLAGTDSSAVTLACSNLPALTTCTFGTNPVTPGASGGSSTLTIATQAPVYAWMVPPSTGLPPPALPVLLLAMMLLVLVGWWRVRRESPRWAAATCLLLGALLATTFMVGCGAGGSGYPLPKVGGTVTGTYTVTITGTSGSTAHTTTVTLTVNAS